MAKKEGKNKSVEPVTGEELSEELQNIYTDKDGNLPDFTKLDGKQSSRWKSVFWGMLVFFVLLAGVSWAGFFYFSDTSGFTGEGVQLGIVTENEFTAGAETEVVIYYANKENLPLARSTVSIELPEEFILLESQPEPNDNGEWLIGSIAPDKRGEIRLRGWIRGEPDAALTFRAELDYTPADFSSKFQKISSQTVVINDSVITIVGTGPENMTPGDEIEFVYEYENTSDREVGGLQFAIDILEGFLFESAEPAPDEEGSSTWTLPLLESKEKGSITIRGTFASEARGPKILRGRIGFGIENAELVSVAQADARTEVLKSELALNLIINGSSGDTNASFGDILNVTISYENGGDVNLRDVELTAELPSNPNGIIDWVTLKDDLEGEREGESITWTKSEIPDLKLLEPGEKGTIDFSVQLIKKPIADAASKTYEIDSTISAKIGRVGTISGSKEIATAPLTISLNSDTVFKTFGRYFTEDGIPLGSGPLPPKVGEKTNYRIFWIVENSLHELTNLSMETVLPQGVKWSGVEREVGAGDLSFDESGRKATWRLNRLPLTVERLIVSFEVEFTPEFEDVGRIVDITSDNRFEALDKETGNVILLTEGPVGTDLIGDETAAAKGVVQE